MIKDIHIPACRIRKELKILGILFGLVCLFNLVSILIYKTSLLELLTMLPVVVVITCVLYIVCFFVRWIFSLCVSKKPQP